MKSKPTLLLLLYFAAIIIICYSGYSFYNYVLQNEKHQAYTNISHAAGLKISQIKNWQNERISDASFIQHNTSINRMIFNFLNNPGDTLLKQEIIDWIKELKENHEYVDIILIDKNYNTYCLFDSNYQLRAIDSIFLKNSFNDRKIELGGAYKEPNTGKLYIGTIIPLSLNNEIFGYMKLKIDPKVNFYPMIETVPLESKTAETFIVRRDGDSVTFLHDLRFKKNTALTFKLPLTLHDLPSAMAVKGKTGIVEGTDYNGKKVLAYINKVEGTHVFLVSKINMDEVYAPVRRQALFIILGVTGLIAILGLIINSLWKNQKIQYLNSQLDLEKELEKSRKQFESVIETAMDGVITVNENHRIVLFNKASEKIFGIDAKNAHGLPIETFIPHRFHEEHKKNMRQFAKDSPETRYMGKEGIISGRRANDEEMLMEASISYFEIDGQKYYTVIHRDVTEKIKTQEALKKSEEKFSKIFKNSPVAKAIADADNYSTLDVNTAFEQLYGYSRDEVIGKTSADLQLYDDMEQREEIISKIKAQGYLRDVELTIRRKNGERCEILISIEPMEIEGKKCLMAVSLDISDRKRAEKALRETEERFSTAFSLNPTALVISRVDDGKLIEVNEAFLKLFRYTREEAIGKTSVELGMYANPDDRLKAIKSMQENGFLHDYEITGKTKSGEERIILLSAALLKMSYGQAFLTIIQDVTDKKLAELALLESEKRFRDLADAMPQIVWTARADGSVDYYSKQINELEGITLIESGLWEWTPVVHEDDIQKTAEAWQNAVNTGNAYEVIHRIKKKGGGYSWFLSRGIPTKNEHGEILRWYGTSTDISLQKEAEEKLKLSESRFRDLIETQQEMIIRINPAGQFTFVNDAFCRKFGVNKNEYTGESFVPLVHPDDIPLAFDKIMEMERPPYNASVEIREYTSEGLCWIEWHGTAIRDSEGKVIEFQAVGRDIHQRKLAEFALLQSEAKLKEAQALAHLGSWELDLIKNELTWSDEVYRIFGLQPQQFGATYEAFLEAVHPDDRDAVNEAYTGSIRDGKDSYEMEHRVLRKTGEVRVVLEKCRHMRNENGTIIRSVGMVHDITELKQAEEELKERERQFRTFAENSPEVIARFDRYFRHTFVNKYGSIVYGVPQEKIIGKTSADLGMPADKVEFWNAYFEEVFRTGKQQTVEFDFDSPNLGHQYFSSLFVPEFDEQGEVVSVLAITRDITERRQLEEKLRESEQRIKKKLESIISPEGDIGELELAEIIDTATIQKLMDNFYRVARIPMSIIDLKGNILVGVGWQKICTEFHRVHPESHKYCLESDLELSRGALPGEFKLYKCKNNMWDLSSPIIIGGRHLGNLFIGQFYFDKDLIDYDTFREQARRYGFDEDEYMTALESVPRLSEEAVAAGSEFFIKLSNMISKLSFNNIQLARLVTERDNLLKSLRTSEEELKRSNKDLEQFAYISSHDLQEPIRMISSYAQLIKIKNKDRLESTTGEFLGFIIEGATRMQQLVDDLLKYSRISTSKQESENVDLNILLKNILADIRFRIEEENAVIEIDKLPEVKGSTTQLRQLFQNFITNSLKFRREERPEIKISCEKRDGKWLFSIKDNGIGIEKQYYDRIFVIFQRLHDRDKYPGSGIGLALCKKIIERHGGQVCVESEPGKGTVFYFTLPA